MKHGNSAYSFPNSVITDSDMFTIHIFEYRYCGNITASAVGIEAISWISLEIYNPMLLMLQKNYYIRNPRSIDQ